MAYKLKIGPSQGLKLKGNAGFALPLIGGTGIATAKSGGMWTVSLDFSEIQTGSIVNDDTAYILTWDSATELYTRLNVTDLKAEIESTFDGYYQPLDATLTALAALDSTAGLLVQTGEDTFERRTLTGTASEIDVADGAGTAGNPTVSLPGALTFTGKTVTGGTFQSPAINTPTGIVKGDVGLGNVDNTSDANKPVSTATQTALNGKQPLDAQLSDIAGITYAQGDILYFNGTNLARLGAGTSGQFLKTLGAAANPAWDSVPGGGDMLAANNLSDVASTTTSRANLATAPNDLSNVSLSVGASAGALTIALKDGAGNDATATTPIVLDFRDPTGTTGARTKLTITAATSLTLSSGSTLGVTSSTAFRLWVVGFNDGGTFRLGAVLCTDAVAGRFALLEAKLASSTAEGGAGGADSALTIYTGTAVTNKAFRVLGYIEWSSSGLTAGTWTTTNINYVQTFGPGVKLPGESIQRRWNYTTTATSNATSTFADTNLQKAITPTSAANAVRVHVQGGLLCPAAATRGAVQLRRGSGATGPQIGMVAEAYGNGAVAIMPVYIDWLDFPQSASSVTYTAQVASQLNVGTVQFPQAPSSSSNVYGFIELEEIQS